MNKLRNRSTDPLALLFMIFAFIGHILFNHSPVSRFSSKTIKQRTSENKVTSKHKRKKGKRKGTVITYILFDNSF
jgi:hypothetical protein